MAQPQLATPGNIVLFGHRTTHGAPFLNINLVPIGGGISLIGDDGHSYNYIVVRQDVTVPNFNLINNIGLNVRNRNRAAGCLHATALGHVPLGHHRSPRQRHLRFGAHCPSTKQQQPDDDNDRRGRAAQRLALAEVAGSRRTRRSPRSIRVGT